MGMSTNEQTVEELFANAFNTPRDPRSPEYKAGVRALLRRKFGLTNSVVCPYTIGTSQADAFFSGTDEGHRIYRQWKETQGG
jgi:hypothetical protein